MPGPKAKPRMPGRSLEAQSANAASSTSESPPQKSFGLRMMLRAAGADAPPCPSDICPPRFTARTPPSRFLCACCPHASTAAPPRVKQSDKSAQGQWRSFVLRGEGLLPNRIPQAGKGASATCRPQLASGGHAAACARTARSADPSALPALRCHTAAIHPIDDARREPLSALPSRRWHPEIVAAIESVDGRFRHATAAYASTHSAMDVGRGASIPSSFSPSI